MRAPAAGTCRVGVVGVTGAVGKEMIDVMMRRGWVPKQLVAFASERSAGGKVTVAGKEFEVQAFSLEAARELDVVFLAVSGEFATEFGKQIAAGGAIVVDNSSAFRYDDDVPLVVPEVNGDVLTKEHRLIANPNCTTAIAVMALHPLHQSFGLKKVIVSTYQAASGAGVQGMDELLAQTRQALDDDSAKLVPKVFAHPLAFNLIPQIDKFMDNGYTKEEMKVVWETRKILRLPDVAVSCTAVRIPILRAHSEAITIETERKVTAEEARAVLAKAVGVKLADAPAKNLYPMPLTATRADDVEVGRVRQNLVFGDCGLDFFVSGDQLLRGAALNAVLIAEVAWALRVAPPTATESPAGKKARAS